MVLSYLRLNRSIAPFLDLNLLNLNLLDLSCSFLIIHHSRLLQDQPKQQRIQWLLNIPGGELLSIYQWLLGTLLFPIKSISKYHYFYLWKLSLDFILSVLYLSFTKGCILWLILDVLPSIFKIFYSLWSSLELKS